MASINDLAAAAIATSSGQQNAAGRGALIVLEGLDRSGKTTQVKLLEQRFVEAGKKVKVMRFPGESVFAKQNPRSPTNGHLRGFTLSTTPFLGTARSAPAPGFQDQR